MWEQILAPFISTGIVIILIGIIYKGFKSDITELKESKQSKEIAEEQNKVIHECFDKIGKQLEDGSKVMSDLDKNVALLNQKLEFVSEEKKGS